MGNKMDEFELILDEDEIIKIKDNNHDLHVKLFLEQIVPYIEKNPGCRQAILKRSFPKEDHNDFLYTKVRDFLYYMSKENLVKRRKAGNTIELFINGRIDQIRDFITSSEEEWEMKIAWKPSSSIDIKCVVYPNSNKIINSYFDDNTIKIIKKYFPSNCTTVVGGTITINMNDSSSKFFSSIGLTNIGGSIKFDMNDVLEGILKKYWTDECENELKNYLLKYGFFADSFFYRSKYGEIIGENKMHELFDELEQHASKIKISYCGWEAIKPSHIPLLYIQSFKFKWGLMPEMVEKKCQYCDDNFIPDYHLSSIIQELETNFKINSLNEIDFCLNHALGKNMMAYDGCEITLPKDKMIQFIKDLINLINFIPASSFKSDLSYLKHLDRETFIKVIKLLNDMPPYQKSFHTPYGYKDVFGSWFKALIEADVLENDSQKTGYGYRVLANDGHECLSLGEKNIDDWLYLNKIPHDKEPLYPGVFLRGDWKVGNYFIEYWGLYGNEDYDNKILIKREIAKEHNITLIEIFPEDIPNLKSKLSILK